MSVQDCDQEQAVVRAAVSGKWPAELQAHADICVSCRAVMGLSNSLKRLVDSPRAQLPPAGYVWWQSRLRDRRAAQLRVTRLYAITHTATVFVSIIGLTASIIWSWSEVGESIRGGLSLRSITGSPSGVAVLILLIVALLCVNVTLTIRKLASDKQIK